VFAAATSGSYREDSKRSGERAAIVESFTTTTDNTIEPNFWCEGRDSNLPNGVGESFKRYATLHANAA